MVPATVDGRPVFVTSLAGHDGGDCYRPETHNCCDRDVRLWDATTGDLLRTFPTGGSYLVVTGHRAVVCGYSNTPQVLDLRSGEILGELTGHRDVVQELAVWETSVVSTGCDGIILISDLDTGVSRAIETGYEPHAMALLEVDGRALAVTAGDQAGIWDLTLGTRIGSLPVTPIVRQLVTWPGGGSLVAVLSMAGAVTLFDVVSGRQLPCAVTVTLASGAFAGLVTAGGRRLLAVGDPEAVQLWDVAANRPAGPPLVGPTDWCGMSAGGPGVLVTVSDSDDALVVWQVGDEPPPAPGGAGGTITRIAIGPDGQILAEGTDGLVTSWRRSDGERGPGGAAMPPPARAAGPAVVTVDHEDVYVQDGESVWHADRSNESEVTALAVHDLVAAVGRADGTVTLLDTAAHRIVDSLTLPYPVTALAWTPTGELAIGCRRELLLVSR